MTPFARTFAVVSAASAILTMPAVGVAQSFVSQHAAAEFEAYLPRLPEIPWLKLKTAPSQRSQSLPEAGSLSALLFQPAPATGWPARLPQSAEAVSISARM